MSPIRQAVERYLRVRRALGYKLLVEGRMLARFATFLEERGQDHVTTNAALQWATAPVGADPQWWAARLTACRCFARFQAGFDARTEIPPVDLLARTDTQRPAPYLYSAQDIAALLQAARRMRRPIRAATFESFIGLLASTGMRTGEAMNLDRDHVDLHRGMLTVHGTKFGKSRRIPLHPTVIEQLDRYQHQRDLLCPRPVSPAAFFCSAAGTRLNHTNVSKAFNTLLAAAGIRAEPKPRLYDLRHTFAVTTLANWYERNLDVAHLLPTLSTYLGHVSPATTCWYLHACPPLMTAAAERLESFWSRAS
jgi:integrase/recombinase XerD